MMKNKIDSIVAIEVPNVNEPLLKTKYIAVSIGMNERLDNSLYVNASRCKCK